MYVQLEPEIENQLDDVVKQTGQDKNALVSEALASYLEDRRDALSAAERLKHVGDRISLEEIGRKYGLVDRV